MTKLAVTIDGHTHEVEFHLTGAALQVTVDGTPAQVALPDWDAAFKPMEWMLVDGRSYEIVFDPELGWLRGYGGLHHLEVRDLEAGAARPRSADGRVKAPIPGHIKRLFVAPGQTIEAGQPLLILEAMKMENEIRAPRAGTIASVHVVAGQGVTLGELLVEVA